MGASTIRPLSRTAAAGEIDVFDIDVHLRETLGNRCQHTWLIRGFDHEYLRLEREHACFTQKHERFGRIAYHHAHHGVIDCVGCSERVDVYFRLCQRFTHARKRPGTICKKDRELGGGFDGELRMWIHADFQSDAGNSF